MHGSSSGGGQGAAGRCIIRVVVCVIHPCYLLVVQQGAGKVYKFGYGLAVHVVVVRNGLHEGVGGELIEGMTV